MKCILARVHVGCLSRSPTLWTKKNVMIIQTLPPVTGSILLPELLSIRTTSGASSITVRKELKETARVWHILWGVIVSPRGIFGRSHYRVLIQTSCFSVGNNKVFGKHATNQHDLGWCLLLVDIVPLLASWEWLPKPSPGNTMHVMHILLLRRNKQFALNNNPTLWWQSPTLLVTQTMLTPSAINTAETLHFVLNKHTHTCFFCLHFYKCTCFSPRSATVLKLMFKIVFI